MTVASIVPSVSLVNGRPATTSQKIAEHFSKPHDRVLKDIRNLCANCPKKFSAVNFDGAVREKLAAVQERLLAAGARGRFSRRENLHLTLCFLGETAPKRLPSVRRAMDAVSFSPFPLEFETAGRFRRTGGDLWWVGVRPEPGLFRLQRELAERLSKEGFRLESRAFQPHVTLAREVRMAEAPAPKALMP